MQQVAAFCTHGGETKHNHIFTRLSATWSDVADTKSNGLNFVAATTGWSPSAGGCGFVSSISKNKITRPQNAQCTLCSVVLVQWLSSFSESLVTTGGGGGVSEPPYKSKTAAADSNVFQLLWLVEKKTSLEVAKSETEHNNSRIRCAKPEQFHTGTTRHGSWDTEPFDNVKYLSVTLGKCLHALCMHVHSSVLVHCCIHSMCTNVHLKGSGMGKNFTKTNIWIKKNGQTLFNF